MTVFELDLGDPAAVETLRQDSITGEVVDRRVRDHGGPVPMVTVQVGDHVRLEVPESEATHP